MRKPPTGEELKRRYQGLGINTTEVTHGSIHQTFAGDEVLQGV